MIVKTSWAFVSSCTSGQKPGAVISSVVPTCVRSSLGGQHQEHCARSHGSAQCWCWLSLIRTLAAGTHTQPQSGHIEIIKRNIILEMSGVLLSCMCTYSAVLSQCPHAILFPTTTTNTPESRKTNIFVPAAPSGVESGPGLHTNPSIANVIKSIVIHTHAFSLLQPATMDTW